MANSLEHPAGLTIIIATNTTNPTSNNTADSIEDDMKSEDWIERFDRKDQDATNRLDKKDKEMMNRLDKKDAQIASLQKYQNMFYGIVGSAITLGVVTLGVVIAGSAVAIWYWQTSRSDSSSVLVINV